MATLEKPADLTAHPGTPVGHLGQLGYLGHLGQFDLTTSLAVS